MVGRSSNKSDDLLVGFHALLESLGCEGCPTVTDVVGGNNTMIHAHPFEGVNGLDGFMCCQLQLMFHMNQARGKVNHDATSNVARRVGPSTAGAGHSLGGADKVVHRNHLPRKQLVLLQHRRSVHHGAPLVWSSLHRSSCLLAKLTCCTLGHVSQLGSSHVQGPGGCCPAEDT